MADPFYDIIEADLARKCSADAADVLRRTFQLCDTRRGAVVVGAVANASPALIVERQRIASLPAMPADVKGGGHG